MFLHFLHHVDSGGSSSQSQSQSSTNRISNSGQEKDDSNDGEEKKEDEEEEEKPMEPARRISLPDDVEDTHDPIRVKCRDLIATSLKTKRGF